MLKVRVEGELSAKFESLLGVFQGDSLSGKLFTLVLAGALIELRQQLAESPPHIPNPPISKDGMPQQSEYSDDVNFMNTSKASLEAILPIAKEVFKDFNLNINTEKTEFTHVYLAPVGETIPGREDTLLRDNEECCVVRRILLLVALLVTMPSTSSSKSGLLRRSQSVEKLQSMKLK